MALLGRCCGTHRRFSALHRALGEPVSRLLLSKRRGVQFVRHFLSGGRLQPLYVAAASVLHHSKGLRESTHSSMSVQNTPELVVKTAPPLGYEIIRGALARGCKVANGMKGPPTVLLVHGILGSLRNLQAFARRLVKGFPAWQAVLVDLRCHGSSQVSAPLPGPHSVEAAAKDILLLLSSLKLFPQVLIGHSLGGKVVMSMAEQFGKRLPRPVQVWVLDALPGGVRAGERNRVDHPSDLIAVLKSIPMPLKNRSDLIDYLSRAGFSRDIACWMTTNLRTVNGLKQRILEWSFDIDGVEEMYRSYEDSNLWPLLADTPEGLRIDFVRAEGSHYKWAGRDEELIKSHGHKVHLLKNSGHWVHTDNPTGLFDIIANSMGPVDLRMHHTSFRQV